MGKSRRIDDEIERLESEIGALIGAHEPDPYLSVPSTGVSFVIKSRRRRHELAFVPSTLKGWPEATPQVIGVYSSLQNLYSALSAILGMLNAQSRMQTLWEANPKTGMTKEGILIIDPKTFYDASIETKKTGAA